MKNKPVILIIFIFYFLSLHAREEPLDKHFYYYKGEKVYLDIDYSRISVISKGKMNVDNIREMLNCCDFSVKYEGRIYTRWHIIPVDEMSASLQNEEIMALELVFSENQPPTNYFEIIQILLQVDNIIKVSPAYTVSGKDLGISNNFYVKLHKKEDLNLLFDLAREFSMQVLGYNEFMPLWFTLSCNRETPLGAVEAAKRYYETGLFENTFPEFLYHNLLLSNDPYFPDQWGLKNTGQYGGIPGIDIKAEDAWAISKGSNVVVTVFDAGFELNHPDLVNNLYGMGYDAETNTTPAQIYDPHGTACTGIIGAQQNNSIGVSGVAPEAKLMSISLNLNLIPTPQQLADGFNWAWKNGADVISNSWKVDTADPLIENAIDSALIFGRNGKGCVVVFASGNDNSSTVLYPAALPNVIAVGAISPCGERKSPSSCDRKNWGSHYGTMLDVVAPGVDILTTTDQGSATSTFSPDYELFSGTSFACPHVAGVAALILSVNYTLTGQQVRDIIESTAQKVGTYTYSTTPGRPNGTWHEEMGYGLVDAYAAVSAAVNSGIIGLSTICGVCTYTLVNPAPATWTVSPSGSFSIAANPAGTSATITALSLNGTAGTLTAITAGNTFTKAIRTCAPVITGPSTLCGTEIYEINNHNQVDSWTVTPQSAFSVTVQIGPYVAVEALKFNGTSGTLTAWINGIAVDYPIQACDVAISGPSTICTIGTYELSTGIYASSWSVAPARAFSITAQNTTSATVTSLLMNGQAGTLTAFLTTGVAISYTIKDCNVSTVISGPDAVCSTGIYTLENGTAAFWTVSPYGAFTVSEQSATSAIVTALYPNANGTLTALLGGTATVEKVITTCSYTLGGPSTLCDCSDNYYPNNLPSGVSQGSWTVTNNSLLQVVGNGASGCTLTRISIQSYDTDYFEISPINIYPKGEVELIFQFEWNGNNYSVSKTINFGVTPSIEDIFQYMSNQPAAYSDPNNCYVLVQGTPYYFSAEEANACSYTYRWVVSPEEWQPVSPSSYTGINTQHDPVYFLYEGSYTLSMSMTDGCGQSEKVRESLYIVPYFLMQGPVYILSPNPFSSYLNFTRFVLGPCKIPSYSCNNTILIYDIQNGNIVFNQSCWDFCASSFSINLAYLLSGLYLVCLIQNGQIIQSSTVIK